MHQWRVLGSAPGWQLLLLRLLAAGGGAAREGGNGHARTQSVGSGQTNGPMGMDSSAKKAPHRLRLAPAAASGFGLALGFLPLRQ